MSRAGKRLSMLMYMERGRCHYCGRRVKVRDHRHRSPNRATVEHIVPRSRGGTDTWTNITLACQACNEAKGNMMPAPSNQGSNDERMATD